MADIIKNNFVVTIENLLINSKYWLEKNEIDNPTINIHIDGRKIILYDNGIGVSKDVENNLFEAFVTAKPDSEGRGLGLYISSQLINEIDGSLTLDDERNIYGNKYKFVIKL
jgi:C4-dicarboxylate-specific signal transduction histidine kinase